MTESHTFLHPSQRNPAKNRVSSKAKHKTSKHMTTRASDSSNSSHTKDIIKVESYNKVSRKRSDSKTEAKARQREPVGIQAEPQVEQHFSFRLPLDVQVQIEKIARQLRHKQIKMLNDQQNPPKSSAKTGETGKI